MWRRSCCRWSSHHMHVATPLSELEHLPNAFHTLRVLLAPALFMQAWEARLQALQQDLSTECRRRLESLDAEWAARCDARVAGGPRGLQHKTA